MPAIEPPYLTYARYLRERHGCLVYRVAVDAGFTCPNRHEGRSGKGCTFCAEEGARAPYQTGFAAPSIPSGERCGMPPGAAESLRSQVQNGVSFLRRRYGAEAFILFFQAYSNTNAPARMLRQVYDAGLALAPFKGLNVATRPDCLDAEKADLLASYRDRGLEVWVELGLQSAHDATLRRIGRGHTVADFLSAHRLLVDRGLKVAIHLILGLPGEGAEEILDTARWIARQRPDGVKIHNLHVPKATVLAREFLQGEITVPAAGRHLEYVISMLEQLPPETVIMRLTCDTPRQMLAAPRGFPPKQAFMELLAQEMRARGARQGRLYQ
jgi:radical SAM protein (TIGR01212 family)